MLPASGRFSTQPDHPQPEYNDFGSFTYVVSTPKDGAPRRYLNIVAICLSIVLPWAYFCLIYACASFDLRYWKPWLCCLLLAFALLPVVVLGLPSLKHIKTSKRQPPDGRGSTWYSFILMTMSLSWILGIIFGNMNFRTNMKPSYQYNDMNVYTGVDPATVSGNEMLDAGQVGFVDASLIDVRKSIGFQNLDLYCVAPITVGGRTLDSYDFWAVGLDCCSTNSADFNCGEYSKKEARMGLRVLDPDQQSFFNLAVRQAEVAYNIKTTHPLFFYWVQSAKSEIAWIKDEGIKYYLIGLIAHLALQILCTMLAAHFFARPRKLRS